MNRDPEFLKTQSSIIRPTFKKLQDNNKWVFYDMLKPCWNMLAVTISEQCNHYMSLKKRLEMLLVLIEAASI
jgi:hypothetical protein